MVRGLLLVSSMFLLVGCASRWEHADKVETDFYGDDRACQIASGGVVKGIEPGVERISYESCMRDKGWRKKQTVWFFDPAVN